MKKTYWLVVLTYAIMQLSSLIVVPILLITQGVDSESEQFEQVYFQIVSNWSIFSFIVGLIIILFLLRHDLNNEPFRAEKASLSSTIVWSILGIFLAMFAQGIAVNIETNLLGIKPGSENTQMIMEIVKAAPLFIIVTSIVAPILEELIFRKIIFGSLYKRTNFFIAAIISSLIFAVIHMDLKHTLVYTAMGLVFAFLYVKTNRIIVPIMAHVAMNTIAVSMQFIYGDDIEKMIQDWEQMQQVQAIIGGLFQ
ncbi:CPBP family intramembrane metalloprotease [Bacillus sp. HMF5848]|uniref:CPBP family intramembrane glutamic endopeptidase n=1 Tax=Bacillus sp. HMF5848 TaxID=2495421 RepID=UPI000F769A16|nr:type II CAAX endopeptidase family protein [Bacillus sp. HMF5848]RSK25679.1 CPBP family intramembrane metalloprotease [Bacillus sp. HMF5848]